MKPGQWVSAILVGACVLLIVVGSLFLMGVGQGIEPMDGAATGADGEVDVMAAVEAFQLPPLDEYSAIVQHPLFNEDRMPQASVGTDDVEDCEDGDPECRDPDAPAPVALNVAVRGIIITGDTKVAMVFDNTTKETLRLKEGMPMEGDMGAWTLSRIEPRKLVFEGGPEGSAEVELETYTRPLKGGGAAQAAAPQPSRPGTQSAAASVAQERVAQQGGAQAEKTQQDPSGAEATEDDDRAAKAEEIRRRVAERRAQLRAEAARRRAEQDDDN